MRCCYLNPNLKMLDAKSMRVCLRDDAAVAIYTVCLHTVCLHTGCLHNVNAWSIPNQFRMRGLFDPR